MDSIRSSITCKKITRTRAENAFQQSRDVLAEAQQLSHTGSFGWKVSSGEIFWSEETFRIFGSDNPPPQTRHDF